MQAILFLFGFFSLLLIVQLVYPFVTTLLAQIFGKEKLDALNTPSRDFDFGCIITAYQNAAIAGPLVASLLRQTHQRQLVYLVADECPADFDLGLQDERLVVLRPNPPLRLKVKSIRHAVEHFKRAHDYIAVFDADNLAHPEYLSEINRYANAGHRCIQGQRTAKNLDSTYAALDSMGEHYKNYLERYIPYLLGGSAVISGSGMATETNLYLAYLESPDIQQGQHHGKKMLQEDKILQNVLLRQNERIAYARSAVVFDEKIETGAAVQTQRSRWLFSYFQNIPNALGLLRRGFVHASLNQLYFGFVTLALPMFIQVGLAAMMAFFGLFIAPMWSLALTAALGVFSLNLLWILKLDHAPQPVWNALWQAPRFVLRQVGALLKMRNPNKNFQHTAHRKQISVDEVLRK